MDITYYGNGCPRCKVVLAILENKKVSVKKITDMVQIMEVAEENNVSELPIIVIADNRLYAGAEAVEWAKGV